MSFHTEIGGDPNKPCIRLLELLQAKNIDDQIECHLDVVELGEHPPPYEALSYCWGDKKQLREISCNGEPFQATENLFLALAHLRNDNTDRVLWIDAICINQTNLKERKSQVLVMGKIYSEATKVVIWLGSDPTSDGVNHVFELVETYPEFQKVKVSRRVKLFMDMNFPGSEAYDFASDGLEESGGPSEPEGTQPPALSRRVMEGITSTMRRTWWTRGSDRTANTSSSQLYPFALYRRVRGQLPSRACERRLNEGFIWRPGWPER
ncbi:heterokaryon incompatibility protein-domain-containing protein [Dactylonectria estremocensis]|uniref:Heterokaryon incompatibility protein-domain-containing protein n=1 Tax=Dactylonectria estremocensis TaxID=1079267 RepID=A0A9P9IL96_9HYPO|nr:heterokaryon incompatibility protein-domain-containing protein [Dactylonectria estremocensis]